MTVQLNGSYDLIKLLSLCGSARFHIHFFHYSGEYATRLKTKLEARLSPNSVADSELQTDASQYDERANVNCTSTNYHNS